MALQFSETAPGVHTTTLTDPKTDRRHNVAIIESCDAWQLFVDGELKTRDMPSFKAAVAAAQAQVTARRSSSMIRVASALVLVSVAGAATIGLTKVISPVLGSDPAVAEVTSDAKGPEIPARFTRVTAPPKRQAAKEISIAPKTNTSIDETIVTVAIAPTPVSDTVKTPAPQNEGLPAPANTSPVKTETTTSEIQPIGLRPLTAPTLKEPKPDALPKQTTAKIVELPPVVIIPKAEALDKGRSIEEASAVATNGVPSTETAAEPLPTVNDSVIALAPPLPQKGPVLKAPLIRSARAPIETSRLNSILADIEEEANETEVSPRISQPARAVRVIKRRAPKRKKTAKRSRRSKRSTHARRNQTVRRKPIHTARVHRQPPARRMVCFAHTCRFR